MIPARRAFQLVSQFKKMQMNANRDKGLVASRPGGPGRVISNLRSELPLN